MKTLNYPWSNPPKYPGEPRYRSEFGNGIAAAPANVPGNKFRAVTFYAIDILTGRRYREHFNAATDQFSYYRHPKSIKNLVLISDERDSTRKV
jgi:hypothetical protein